MTGMCSSVFVEADKVSLFSKASSADHKLVLSDETTGSGADSACSGILSEVSWVTTQLVGHLLFLTLF